MKELEQNIYKHLKKSRLTIAAHVLTTLPSKHIELLEGWLEQMPSQDDVQKGELLEYVVSLALNLKCLKCTVGANPRVFSTKFRQFLLENDFNKKSVEACFRALSNLDLVKFQSWIELTENGFDLGCNFTLQDTLLTAFEYAPHENTAIKTALEAASILEVSELGFSFGKTENYTMLLCFLNGKDANEQLQLAAQIYKQLGVDFLPDAAINLLKTSNEAFQLSVWWGEMGIVKLGIRVPTQDHQLMLRLMLVEGLANENSLAVFEGALEASSPVAIECIQNAQGFAVEAFYEYN